MRSRKHRRVGPKGNLSKARRSLAPHVATKFIKYSLMNLIVTMMKGKEGGRRCLFSNFDALNTAILGLKCGVG